MDRTRLQGGGPSSSGKFLPCLGWCGDGGDGRDNCRVRVGVEGSRSMVGRTVGCTRRRPGCTRRRHTLFLYSY